MKLAGFLPMPVVVYDVTVCISYKVLTYYQQTLYLIKQNPIIIVWRKDCPCREINFTSEVLPLTKDNSYDFIPVSSMNVVHTDWLFVQYHLLISRNSNRQAENKFMNNQKENEINSPCCAFLELHINKSSHLKCMVFDESFQSYSFVHN